MQGSSTRRLIKVYAGLEMTNLKSISRYHEKDIERRIPSWHKTAYGTFTINPHLMSACSKSLLERVHGSSRFINIITPNNNYWIYSNTKSDSSVLCFVNSISHSLCSQTKQSQLIASSSKSQENFMSKAPIKLPFISKTPSL